MTKEYREYVISGEIDQVLWDETALSSLEALGLVCVRSFASEVNNDVDNKSDSSIEPASEYDTRLISEKTDFMDYASYLGKQRPFAGKVWGRLERLHMLKSKPEAYERCAWYDAADYQEIPDLFIETQQDYRGISRFTATGLKLESLETLLAIVNTARQDQGDSVIPCYLGKHTGALVMDFLEQFVVWKRSSVLSAQPND